MFRRMAIAMIGLAALIFIPVPAHAFRIKVAHQSGEVCGRKLDIRYPYVVGGPKQVTIRVNREIHACINRQIGPLSPGTEGMEFAVDYKLESFSDNRLSILFQVQTPTGGAVQDIRRLVGFNCDLRTGAVLHVRDVVPGVDSGKLASAVERKVKERGSEWSRAGRQLRNFVIQPNGIAFAFDELELAPASRSQVIPLTREELRRLRRW